MSTKKESEKKKRPTAEKRMIQNAKRRQENRVFKSRVKTAIRRFEEALAKKEGEEIKATLSSVYSLMDKGVKKNVFKLNKASRTKARLTAKSARI